MAQPKHFAQLQYSCPQIAIAVESRLPIILFCIVQLFYFIEDAPLLCILEDFLPQLDRFLVEQESRLDLQNFITDNKSTSHKKDAGQQSNSSQEQVKPRVLDQRGNVDPGSSSVDEDFVKALEIYCLLKQRRLDLEYHWCNVKDSLSDHGKYAGILI